MKTMKQTTPTATSLNIGLLELLFKFIKDDNIDAFNKLFSKNREEIEPYINRIVSFESGENCFHAAIRKRNLQIIKSLLEISELDVNRGINENDNDEKTASTTPALRIIEDPSTPSISAPSSTNADDDKEKRKETALHLIASDLNYDTDEGRKIIALLLNEKSIEIDIQTLTGNTPLHITAQNGFTSLVSILLSKNANPNISNDENNDPFSCAANNNHYKTLEVFLQHGVSLSFEKKNTFRKLLENAIREKNRGIVKLLLEYGIGIGQQLSIPEDFFEPETKSESETDLDIGSKIELKTESNASRVLQYPFVFQMELNGKPVTTDTPCFGLAITDLKSLFSYQTQLKNIRTILKNEEFIKILENFSTDISYEKFLEEIKKIESLHKIFTDFDFKNGLDVLAHRLRFLKDDKGSTVINEIKKLFYQAAQDKKTQTKITLLKKFTALAKGNNDISNDAFTIPYKELLSLFENAFGYATNNEDIEKIRRYLLMQSKKGAFEIFCWQKLLLSYPTFYENKNDELMLVPTNDKLPIRSIEKTEGDDKETKDFLYDNIQKLWGNERKRDVFPKLNETKEELSKFIDEIGKIRLLNDEFTRSSFIKPWGILFLFFITTYLLTALPVMLFAIPSNPDESHKGATRTQFGLADIILSLMIGIFFYFLAVGGKFGARLVPPHPYIPSSLRIPAKDSPNRLLQLSSPLQETRNNVINMIAKVLRQFKNSIKQENIDAASKNKIQEITEKLKTILEYLQRARTYQMYEDAINNLIEHIDTVITQIKQSSGTTLVAFNFQLFSPYKSMSLAQETSENNEVRINIEELEEKIDEKNAKEPPSSKDEMTPKEHEEYLNFKDGEEVPLLKKQKNKRNTKPYDPKWFGSNDRKTDGGNDEIELNQIDDSLEKGDFGHGY